MSAMQEPPKAMRRSTSDNDVTNDGSTAATKSADKEKHVLTGHNLTANDQYQVDQPRELASSTSESSRTTKNLAQGSGPNPSLVTRTSIIQAQNPIPEIGVPPSARDRRLLAETLPIEGRECPVGDSIGRGSYNEASESDSRTGTPQTPHRTSSPSRGYTGHGGYNEAAKPHNSSRTGTLPPGSCAGLHGAKGSGDEEDGCVSEEMADSNFTFDPNYLYVAPPPAPQTLKDVHQKDEQRVKTDDGTMEDEGRRASSRNNHRGKTDKSTMLSRALQKANTAVLLDNAQNFEGAMEAYGDACRLLQQVMLRSSGEDDRKKLEEIRVTYTKRIQELNMLDPAWSELRAHKKIIWQPEKDRLAQDTNADLPNPAKDDTWSRSLAGSTLVSASKGEDRPHNAASVTDTGPYEAAREEFISLVRKEKRLEDASKGVEEFLRPEIFEESFRNMFVDFAARLREEASHPEEKYAARAASINRIYIANCVTEGVFKMTELEPNSRKRGVPEAFLHKYKERSDGDNGIEVFKGEEVDDLDAYGGNEPEGPINLLKMEKFIHSTRAWSRMFDNLEGWVQAVKKAKQLDEKAGDVGFNIEVPPLRDTRNQENRTAANLSFESEGSADAKTTVARFQVALFWAWAVKTLAQLYAQSNCVMQALVGCIVIILPMYATILLPREPVVRCYILCLLVPKAYMVYANALGFGILAGFSYLFIPLVRAEKLHIWLWGSLISKKETPHARVKWQCNCGDEFHEDFAEPQEGDAIALFEYLCRTGNRPRFGISSRGDISTTRVFGEGFPETFVEKTSPANSSKNNDQQQTPATAASDSVTRTYSEPLLSSSAHNDSARNNTSGKPESATETAQSSFMGDSGEQRNEWFLLCHDHYENAGKALNIRVPYLLDDLSLMHHLQRQYVASRGFRRHFRWSKIRNFNFVRFQAHLDPIAQEELVFKDKEWGVPPDCCDFNWSPWPLKERPPRSVERMLHHYWHYPHDSMSFRFANACKHLSQNIWQNCKPGYTDFLSFLSHRPAPSSIWTTMRRASSRFYTSVRSWFKKTWSNHKTNTLPQSNHDINLRPQAPQGNDHQQQQHSGTSPAAPPTHSHQGTNPSAVIQPIPQQCLPHSISSVYPRRLHTELHPNPTCYGWGLYLDEGFAVPTPLIALLLTLLFAVLISTLTVALVDFHRGDRYDAFSLPSWAVSVASLVGFILFWCCDRWR